jgi:hypothetical protein
LSLREIAILLRNKSKQIGIDGDKETRKHNKQYVQYHI